MNLREGVCVTLTRDEDCDSTGSMYHSAFCLVRDEMEFKIFILIIISGVVHAYLFLCSFSP